MGKTDRLHLPDMDSDNNFKKKNPTNDIQGEMHLFSFLKKNV